MRKFISVITAVMLLLGICAASYADNTNERAVIGADLSPEQIGNVYNTFGIARGSIPELVMTNARERAELEGLIDPALIGTKSISCVYVSLNNANPGLDITTSENITYCTSQMYISALATAGITNAKVIVTAPFPVSGTAALSGVFWAYEDITGQKLENTAKLVATQELTVSGDLMKEIGEMDATYIINDLKMMLEETKTMSDSEIRSEIKQIASQYNVALTDEQITKLIELCRSLEGLDEESLLKRVEQVQSTLKTLNETKTKIEGFSQSVDKVVTSVKGFFDKIGSIIGYFG